ncbi:universal stress protein [Pseudoduganella eburnea]|uniref:Universal stress protein n=1 Tax=Massilia eburnea TaxID=1776165 RepID=A0A6L6QMP7_9BURK|nr:universal stress protein [Massilia eburnea]MTW13381.1 universal stress protein [Massilia eburnea]
MFRHILIPSDGSAASQLAVNAALRMARESGARVTAVHVLPEEPALASVSAQQAENAILAEIARQAATLHVNCATIEVHADQPHAAIISTALQRGCDLIAMASRGRSGLASLMLGSQTQKVLTHSKIPVLVFREG